MECSSGPEDIHRGSDVCQSSFPFWSLGAERVILHLLQSIRKWVTVELMPPLWLSAKVSYRRRTNTVTDSVEVKHKTRENIQEPKYHKAIFKSNEPSLK